MQLPWLKKSNPPSNTAAPRAADESWTRRLADRLRLPALGIGPVIRFDKVSLGDSIRSLSLELYEGNWALLLGTDEFAKALFCDLCFGFIQPERGKVDPRLNGSDVSFLGRTNITYGQSLLDHLTCGVRDSSKDLIQHVASEVFGDSLRAQLEPDNLLLLKSGRKVMEVDLIERDFLEIAEANLLLQKRAAAVIDTTSDFYRSALEQGFRHSNLFLNSGKTILWILDDEYDYRDAQAPWRNNLQTKKISLYFSQEVPVNHIN